MSLFSQAVVQSSNPETGNYKYKSLPGSYEQYAEQLLLDTHDHKLQ